MSAKIKAIIFDCDGTLVDSEGSQLFAWRRVASSFGRDLTAEESFYFIGKADTDCASWLAAKIGGEPVELLARKDAFYLESLQKGLPPIEGTIQFIHRLNRDRKVHGLKLAVASAASRREVLANLQNLQIEHIFDLVLSGHDDLAAYQDPEGVNKPKPYVYLHTAKLLGVSPAECLVIEDSYTGVTAGVTAGCTTIVIPNSYSQYQDLSHAHLKLDSLADLSLTELIHLLEKI